MPRLTGPVSCVNATVHVCQVASMPSALNGGGRERASIPSSCEDQSEAKRKLLTESGETGGSSREGERRRKEDSLLQTCLREWLARCSSQKSMKQQMYYWTLEGSATDGVAAVGQVHPRHLASRTALGHASHLSSLLPTLLARSLASLPARTQRSPTCDCELASALV